MQSVLNELFYQKLENGEVIKNNKEHKKLVDEACDLYEELEDGTDERREKLNKLWLAEAGQEAESSKEFFKDGFKTCMFIFMEIFGLIK